ncbi:MAG: zinc ribbon domain-containing protein, partial [Pyrinomonadaceae bacterium]|nr:zinc ribbon domain-containing protein [Pyrinomonadaceae bacterium]
MFCPKCGKGNSSEIKYCASCGTNLEAISRALTGREEDFFTKIDGGIDQLFARYTEHVFGDSCKASNENTVVRSWRLLG